MTTTATAALVTSAMERIGAGALGEGSLEGLARELRVSSRHLRRAIRAELGLSPVELEQARRLAVAKQLIDGSRLPLTAIAFASGFKSVRRFNSLFAQAYGRSPSRARARPGDPSAAQTVLLRLERPPGDWPRLLESLAAGAIPGVESVSDCSYCRTVRIGPHEGWAAVSPLGRRGALQAEVSISLAGALPGVVARIQRLLDRNGFDGFENAVRDVLGEPARLRLFARALGKPFQIPFAPLDRFFPSPAEVLRSSERALARLGIPRGPARSLLSLAAAAGDQ